MGAKERVQEHIPDAKVVYDISNKPFVLSNKFLFQSKSAESIDLAWENALSKICEMNEFMLSLGIYNF